MLTRLRALPQFWLIQLIAWPAYGVVSFLGVLPYVGIAPHLDSVRSAFCSKLAFTLAGFAASSVLRIFYEREETRRREQARGASWARIVLSVAALSYAAGVLAAFCGNTARELVSGKVLGGGWSGFFGGAINASAVFLAWSACYFAVRNYQSAENEKKAALRANALAHQAQLEMLRSQVNPHFLFNALNSVHALVREDPDRAQTAIEELSDFLRYSLARAKISDVPLAEEIEVLERYLAIEKIRYEEKLSVRVDVGSQAMQIRVPGLLLHPLLENAIKYGMQTSAMPLQIRLEAERVGDLLRVTIANTGRWVKRETENGDARGDACEDAHGEAHMDAHGQTSKDAHGEAREELYGAGAGLGLRLVRERLEQAFPGRHQFACAEQNGWVENSIEIELASLRATAGAA
jgi:two-component system, LytTR family, sensor kinase